MKHFLPFVFLLIVKSSVFGQNVGDTKYPSIPGVLKNVLQSYNGTTCSGTTFDIGSLGEIKFVRDLNNGKYVVSVSKNNLNIDTNNDNFARINQSYCLKKSDYDDIFDKRPIPNSRRVFGMLAVPFKMRFNPTTIAPGGELGGFYGWYLGRSNWIFAFHGGLTFVALNDIDSDTPENKSGFTGGISMVNDVSDSFQIGIVSGVDLFDGVDDWTYGHSPWVSIQFGFKFTKVD